MFIYSVNAFSVSVDGIHNDYEWDSSTDIQLINGESNCKINYVYVKTIIEPDESAVYLCFFINESSLEQDNQNVGLSLNVEDSVTFEMSAGDSAIHSDNPEYSFDGAIIINEINGAICEVRIGFKSGLPKRISMSVRLIDSDGAYSNVCPISIINNYYVETTELIITETTDAPETKKETTKTAKTTRKKTTAYREEKTTDYTLRPKTTKPEKEKTEFVIKTSPPYSYVRKTRAPKTTKASTTASATKLKTTKAKPATVFYYEKEIIISEVYVTVTESTAVSTTVPTTYETSNIIASATETDVVPSTEKESSSSSKGTLYKVLIGGFAVLSFTSLAVCATLKSKKKSDDNDTTESQ